MLKVLGKTIRDTDMLLSNLDKSSIALVNVMEKAKARAAEKDKSGAVGKDKSGLQDDKAIKQFIGLLDDNIKELKHKLDRTADTKEAKKIQDQISKITELKLKIIQGKVTLKDLREAGSLDELLSLSSTTSAGTPSAETTKKLAGYLVEK